MLSLLHGKFLPASDSSSHKEEKDDVQNIRSYFRLKPKSYLTRALPVKDYHLCKFVLC